MVNDEDPSALQTPHPETIANLGDNLNPYETSSDPLSPAGVRECYANRSVAFANAGERLGPQYFGGLFTPYPTL